MLFPALHVATVSPEGDDPTWQWANNKRAPLVARASGNGPMDPKAVAAALGRDPRTAIEKDLYVRPQEELELRAAVAVLVVVLELRVERDEPVLRPEQDVVVQAPDKLEQLYNNQPGDNAQEEKVMNALFSFFI